MRIWKYELDLDASKNHKFEDLEMPKGAKILTVDLLGAYIVLWARVDPVLQRPHLARRRRLEPLLNERELLMSRAPSILSQVITRQRQRRRASHDAMSVAMLLADGVQSRLLLEQSTDEAVRKKKLKAERINHSGGIVAPPMPTGPTRCACGSGRRPKKCCGKAAVPVS